MWKSSDTFFYFFCLCSLSFFFLCLSLYIYIYMVFITERFFQVAIESWIEWVWTHDHWIPFRRSNRLSYQTMSSTRTQSQLCTAAPISSFVQYHISFRLLLSSVDTFVLIEILLRYSNECSGMGWHIYM